MPFLIVLKISLSQTAIAQPPYTPVLDLAAGWAGVMRNFFAGLSFDNYASLAADPIYLASYLKSLQVAACRPPILLVIGYPARLRHGARCRGRLQPLLVTLVILPFWTSFLIRVYAWINILQRDGLLNQVLLALRHRPTSRSRGSRPTPRSISASSIRICRSWCCRSMRRSRRWTSAARSGGRSRLPAVESVLAVTLPLSLPGVAAGALLCFIPIVGEFVIPDLLGGSETMMIGQTLWTEFFTNRDWPVASAVAVVLLCCWSCRSSSIERLRRRAGCERG